jgi:hypothetical protein
MALVDRITNAKTSYKKTFMCKLISVLQDPKLTEADVDAVISVINSSPLAEGYVPNIRLAYALREEGYDVSSSAVDRHRRRDCACYRVITGA